MQWRGKDARKCCKVKRKTIKKWFLRGNLRRKVVYRRQNRAMEEKRTRKWRKVKEKSIKRWFLRGTLRRKEVYCGQNRAVERKECTKLS